MNIGEQLKKARLHAHFTQKDLAKKMGVSIKTISVSEGLTDHPPTKSVMDGWAEATGIPGPIMLWLAMEESDVKPGKRKAFSEIKTSVDQSIAEIFFTK